jgi:hypothetical protein
MTPEAQRIAIAEACGWKESSYEEEGLLVPTAGVNTELWISSTGQRFDKFSIQPCYYLPDYLSDLNAMHEAEKVLEMDEHSERASSRPQDHAPLRYYHFLLLIVRGEGMEATNFSPFDYFKMATATAAQRAEAFLRTLNLWKD